LEEGTLVLTASSCAVAAVWETVMALVEVGFLNMPLTLAKATRVKTEEVVVVEGMLAAER
jgi:hypothetical protein